MPRDKFGMMRGYRNIPMGIKLGKSSHLNQFPFILFAHLMSMQYMLLRKNNIQGVDKHCEAMHFN